MDENTSNPIPQPNPVHHGHTDEHLEHTEIAGLIFGTLSAHIESEHGSYINSYVHEHKIAGRKPGGAEGKAMDKAEEKKEQEKKDSDKHVIK